MAGADGGGRDGVSEDQREREDGRRFRWSGCCGFTSCSCGSTCRTRPWRKRCTTRWRCAASSVSIWASKAAPDETTVCKFRHLLERHKLGKTLLTAVNEHLHRSGIKIAKGTIVDATIIGAPSSTKNKDGKRDPEMHQTAKGQQWYFGMKAHIGVDSQDEADPHGTGLRGQRGRCAGVAVPAARQGDAGLGRSSVSRPEGCDSRAAAPRARDFTNQRYRWGSRIDEADQGHEP